MAARLAVGFAIVAIVSILGLAASDGEEDDVFE